MVRLLKKGAARARDKIRACKEIRSGAPEDGAAVRLGAGAACERVLVADAGHLLRQAAARLHFLQPLSMAHMMARGHGTLQLRPCCIPCCGRSWLWWQEIKIDGNVEAELSARSRVHAMTIGSNGAAGNARLEFAET